MAASFKLVYRYSYHVAEHGFPSRESAHRYNQEHYVRDPKFGAECHVEEDPYAEPFRLEDGSIPADLLWSGY